MCGLRAAAWAGKRLFGIWVDGAPHGPAASPVNRERGPAAAGRAAGHLGAAGRLGGWSLALRSMRRGLIGLHA
jgi:hypothetical protein